MKVVIDIPKDFEGDYIVDKFKDFFSRVIADIDCKGMCGRYEKEIAEMFLKSFDDSEEKIPCNCQHNSNSRVKVNSLEIIVRMIGNKPYYELKYRQVGKKDYSIGYSSYDLKIVLGYIDTYFEIVESDNHTNADRIRNMSDEELAELIEQISTDSMETISFGTKEYKEIWERKETALEWLQSEAE